MEDCRIDRMLSITWSKLHKNNLAVKKWAYLGRQTRGIRIKTRYFRGKPGELSEWNSKDFLIYSEANTRDFLNIFGRDFLIDKHTENGVLLR